MWSPPQKTKEYPCKHCGEPVLRTHPDRRGSAHAKCSLKAYRKTDKAKEQRRKRYAREVEEYNKWLEEQE